MIDVVLGAPGIPQEAELVAGAAAARVRVLRRCVDAADLLAACATDARPLVVVSNGLPRLSADVVSRVPGVVIGVAADPLDAEALRLMGIHEVALVAAGMSAEDAWRALLARHDRRPAVGDAVPSAPAGGVWSTGAWEAADPEPGSDRQPVETRPDSAVPDGLLLAVWGPAGAPGRTTIALGLGEALADAGHRVCVVDADTYAPSLALAVGIPDAAGGLLRACRQADGGVLTPESLAASARGVRGRLQVLGGLPRVERWPELRAPALDEVWRACRAAFDVTVVDTGFCIEQDEGPLAFAARRNVAALSAITGADRVLAVADGSAAGAARLVAAWPGLTRTCTAPVTVVCNRRAARDWDGAIAALGVAAPVHQVPADPRAVAACWARGRTLREGARRSPLRRSWSTLAAEVMRR